MSCFSNWGESRSGSSLGSESAFFLGHPVFAKCQMIYPGKFPPKEIKRKEQVCVFVDNTKMIKAYQWSEKGGLIEHFCLCMLSKKWERKREWVIKAFFSSPSLSDCLPGCWILFSLFWDPSMATKPICDLSQVRFGIDASAEDQRLRHRKRGKLGAWDAWLPPPP